jgi:RimJ/RimL family protein N-acetyltransferase
MKDNLYLIEKYGVKMRTVNLDDANFILSLRNDKSLKRFISATSQSIDDQKNWLKKYKERETQNSEYYFIVENLDGDKLGTTRLYNFHDATFELGSWVFKRNEGTLAIIADILTKEFAFENLGFKVCTFNVRKDNKNVLRYHKNYEPKILRSDDQDVFFELSKADFNKNKNKFLRVIG